MRAARCLTAMKVAIATVALLATCTAASAQFTDDPDNANLTYWYWAESDAPGANDWMQARIDEYEALYPGVTIDLVLQSTDTLIGAFMTAAQTGSGPDIATQWAGIFTLSQAWAGAITPISDLVPEDERSDWINVAENTYDGKLWAMPLYIIGVPLAYNKDLLAQAGLDGPPTTYEELLLACDALRAKGITPIGGGNKNGYFGGWFFSNFAKQNLKSVNEMQQAIIGTEDLASEKYTGYYAAMEEMRNRGCFNDDIASIDLDQGSALFGAGKAAMSWGTDGMVANWAKTLGSDVIGVARTPKWGEGALADVYNTTQSSSAFVTSWSEHPRAAAQLLSWLHEPANVASWYGTTGVFPANTGFDQALLSTDLAKAQWELTSQPGGVWLQNYVPPAVDGDGSLAAGQIITSGGSSSDAVQTFVAAAKKWRSQNPAEVEAYTAWSNR